MCALAALTVPAQLAPRAQQAQVVGIIRAVGAQRVSETGGSSTASGLRRLADLADGVAALLFHVVAGAQARCCAHVYEEGPVESPLSVTGYVRDGIR